MATQTLKLNVKSGEKGGKNFWDHCGVLFVNTDARHSDAQCFQGLRGFQGGGLRKRAQFAVHQVQAR